MGALMKGVVAQITQEDMLAIAAYVGSLPPGTEESTSTHYISPAATLQPVAVRSLKNRR